MKNALAVAITSILLSACAGWQTHPATSSVAADNPATLTGSDDTHASPDDKSSPQDAEASDALPVIPLTPEIMYQVLAAEIAFQRGDWQPSYWLMFSLARQTRDPRLAQRAFEMAWLSKQPDLALGASQLWRKLAPHSEEAMQNYLNSIVMDNRLEDARSIFERLLKETQPQARGTLILQIQRLLLRATDKDAAFGVLENLAAPYPDVMEMHLALSFGAFAKGDNVRARQEAETVMKSDPGSEQAALIIAQSNPDKDDALKFLATFLSAHPGAKELRLAYAHNLIDQKRYPEAERELTTLLKAQPDNLTVLYLLGLLEVQIDNPKAAEKHLTTFLDVLSNHPNEERDPTSALLLLSQIAEDRKDNEAALRWLDEIDSQEAYVSVQIRRAEIFSKEGNSSEALKVLAALSTQDQAQQIQIIEAQGQILRDSNQIKEALSVLDAGIKRFPDNTDLLYDYAMVAEKDNQIDICETALRKIIELSPKNQQAYNALGYTFAERNIRLDEAYSLIDTALKLTPDDPFIIDSMGWVQFRLGKLNEAEQLLRRAYSLKQDPEIAVHLGEVLWAKGQKAEAHKLWREAAAKDPDNDSLKSTLTRLHASL